MPAAAGVVEDFQVHEGAAVGVAARQRCRDGVVDAGLDQRLRQHRLGVVAGRGLARVAGAFEVHVAFFNRHFAPGAKAFFFAQPGGVVVVKVGFDGFAFGGAAFKLQIDGVFGGALKAKFEQAFVDAAQVGDAHVLEVSPGLKQGVAPVRFVEQLFKQLVQGGVVEDFGLEQQRGARGVKQAAVEERNVDVPGPFVEHFKQLLEGIHAVVQRLPVCGLRAQGLVQVIQAVALVERVLVQQHAVLVFKIHHEQQAKQQHHTVFIDAGQAGVGAGVVNGAAHDFKQRVFAGVAVNHGLEVFLDRQREVGGRGNGLFNRAGLAGVWRLQVGGLAKEKRKQGQAFGFFNGIFNRQEALQVELDKGLFGGDLVGVVDAPDAAIGQKAKAHAQGAEVILQLVVRVGLAVGFAGVERLVPGLGLANGGNQGVVFAGNELVVLPGLAEQAPVGLGEFALHGDGFLRDLQPAELGQQRADEAVFQLRFAVSGQRGGLKVFSQPRIECVGQRLGGELVGFLNDEAVVKQRVGQPVLREEVLFHAVRVLECARGCERGRSAVKYGSAVNAPA